MNIGKPIKFETYIHRYLVDTSQSNSISIKKLNREVDDNPFLKRIYFLYIFLFDKEDTFHKFTSDTSIYASYCSFRVCFENRKDLYQRLIKRSQGLENESQIYHNYLAYSTRAQNKYDNKIKVLLRIRELRESVNISDYRICKDLNINPGNFHSVYHKGIYRKMSLERCISVLDYVIQQVEE